MTTPRPRSTEPLTVQVPVEPIRPDPAPYAEEFSVVSLVNTALRHRWLIVTLALALGFYSGLKSFRSPRLYTTEAQFMLKGSRPATQMQGLAAQFGIAVGGGDAGQSPQFYMDLIESRPVLNAVANQQYRLRTDTGVVAGNLATLYNIKNKNPAIVRANVTNALKGQISEAVSLKTGVITLRVHARQPGLAVQIARAVLDQVNVFNLSRRQEQASAERAFIEKRLGEAQGELTQAESNLQSFLLENRDFRSSPTLTMEFDRLNRAVQSRQSLYNALATNYEQAKIEEVRDLPVITVLEPPDYPIQPDAHGGLRKVFLGMLVGFAIGILLAFLRDRLAANRERRSGEFVEFSELTRETLADLTHPWRPIGRLLASRRRS